MVINLTEKHHKELIDLARDEIDRIKENLEEPPASWEVTQEDRASWRESLWFWEVFLEGLTRGTSHVELHLPPKTSSKKGKRVDPEADAYDKATHGE